MVHCFSFGMVYQVPFNWWFGARRFRDLIGSLVLVGVNEKLLHERPGARKFRRFCRFCSSSFLEAIWPWSQRRRMCWRRLAPNHSRLGLLDPPTNTANVNPGLINPWLINRGCPLSVGIQTTFGGNTPLLVGRVLLIDPGSTFRSAKLGRLLCSGPRVQTQIESARPYRSLWTGKEFTSWVLDLQFEGLVDITRASYLSLWQIGSSGNPSRSLFCGARWKKRMPSSETYSWCVLRRRPSMVYSCLPNEIIFAGILIQQEMRCQKFLAS